MKERRPTEPESASDAFARRIERLRAETTPRPRPLRTFRNRALDAAFRLSVEMASGLVAGGILGWLLDRLFGTAPWFMLVLFFFGAAAGIRSAVRTAAAIQRELDAAEGATEDATEETAKRRDAERSDASRDPGTPRD